MSTNALSGSASPRPALVASPRHTIVLAVMFIVLAIAGGVAQLRSGAQPAFVDHHPNVIPLYLSLILLEWGLVYYVVKGTKRTGTPLNDLMGGAISSRRNAAVDLVLAAAMCAVWFGLQIGWRKAFGASSAVSVDPLLAKRAAEIPVWILLSMSAGFAEELVFRGYFQRQFHALTGSAAVALVLQAILFGVSHGYQGVDACVKITLFGLLYGSVAVWRRSLRPGMVAHAVSDIISGLA